MSNSLSPQNTAIDATQAISGACPECGKANNCGLTLTNASGASSEFSCWCMDAKFRPSKTSKASATKTNARCLCAICGAG